jgi:NAD(P)-dependent dehydrogenase (short-subunit alcohol dehydrogenase family)
VVSVAEKFEDESGSGTILGFALIASVLTAVSAACLSLQSGFIEQRLQVVANSAAMAASDALNGYSTGFPCEAARAVIDINMFKVEECRIVGFDAFIRIRVQSLGMVHFASARATNVMVAESRE